MTRRDHLEYACLWFDMAAEQLFQKSKVQLLKASWRNLFLWAGDWE